MIETQYMFMLMTKVKRTPNTYFTTECFTKWQINDINSLFIMISCSYITQKYTILSYFIMYNLRCLFFYYTIRQNMINK